MQEDTIAMAFSIMSARQKQKFKDHFETRHGLLGARARALPLQASSSSAARSVLVLRVIPVKILDDPRADPAAVLERSRDEQRGLILVTGTTGSGKSTSLAAMIDYINTTRTEHIMTIEDPIEFLHRDKKTLVNQREVEVDTQLLRRPRCVRPCARIPT
jgi:twitching motility protein PilT